MSSSIYSFGNEQVNNEWNKRIARTAQQRKFIIPDKDTPVSLREAAKYYGYDQEEFIKALGNSDDFNVTANAPSINARGEGWSSIQITPKNKKNVSGQDIKVSASLDETPYLRQYYNVQNSVKSSNSYPVIVGGFQDGRQIVAVPEKTMYYDVDGKPVLDITISEFMTDKAGRIIGEPLATDKTLNDYYYESLKALTNGLHLDKDTKGLTLE